MQIHGQTRTHSQIHAINGALVRMIKDPLVTGPFGLGVICDIMSER